MFVLRFLYGWVGLQPCRQPREYGLWPTFAIVEIGFGLLFLLESSAAVELGNKLCGAGVIQIDHGRSPIGGLQIDAVPTKLRATM
jgi:hypothetical protein